MWERSPLANWLSVFLLRYNSCEEFAADAQLVFNNCELFNEDTSEVGVAGHAMRRFFESRWAEFYSNKDK